MLNSLLLLISLITLTIAYKPTAISKKSYNRLTTQTSNTHFFIITTPIKQFSYLQQKLQQFNNHYNHSHKIEIYLCNPTEHRQYCSFDIELYMIINTIKIQYNGRKDNIDDYARWMRYRIEEMPVRLHSVVEVKQFIADKNQIFCYVDREGEHVTLKEYIFIAIAKKFHFLHFCHIDASIAQQLRLREGHLALIRKDLTYRFDYWSENLPEDHQHLYQIWTNFIISNCQTVFRQQNKDKSHDYMIFQCDFSLQCQDQLLIILDSEFKWRLKHPEINFRLKFIPGHKGEVKIRKGVIYDYPLIRYGKTRVEKRIEYQEETGAVLQQTQYISHVYLQTNPILDDDTIQRVLKDYEQKKLEFSVIDSQIDIRSLDGEQGEFYRQQRRKQKELISKETGKINEEL